ncbi:DUF6507 family protein [Arthrobacter sp. NPDC055585]
MPVSGYDIDLAGCRSILNQVGSDTGPAEAADRLRTGIESAVQAVHSTVITMALEEITRQLLLPQARGVQDRIYGAVEGVSTAINAYTEADAGMAQSARDAAASVPHGLTGMQ